MKSMLKYFGFMLACMLITVISFAQGTTTSAMNGRVTDEQGEPLPGATIVAVHVPTASQFGGITGTQGFYRLPNLNVGGPYKVTISFVGYESFEKTGIYLTLGQTFKLDATLGEQKLELEEVQVVGKRIQDYDMFDGNRTGAETVIGSGQIGAMPSVARDLTDYTRLTPQASVDDYGGISIAGMNNRYNAISIDGAVNNDVFGLAATGTNGGQTGGTPISMDAIEQFQVVLAPYDVRQGGFAGASINAVTRSGSNNFRGSAYFLFRNQSFAGLTPTDDKNVKRKKLDDFTSSTYGFRIGGPIVKNKLFFFLSTEFQREQTPQPYDFSGYAGDSNEADIVAIANKLKDDFGYNPGSFKDKTRTLNSDKLLLRLDWNISEHHKLTLRHSYTNLEALKASRSGDYSITFLNNSEYFPSVTNSTALELKSNYDKVSNNLIVGFTSVRDDRDPYGEPFPSFRIYDGDATIYGGSEPYSTANALDQDVLTITDNFTFYKGRHSITVGTNNEISSTYNLFMRKNFGEYIWSSVADFMTVGTAGEVPAYQYERGYSLVDDITGDGSAAAADFNMFQLGFYVHEEYQVNNNIKITGGLRFDIPFFPTDPKEDTHFNEVTIPELEAAGWKLEGAKAGQMPKSQVLISPRVGFNWDINGNETTQLRGGFGIFTSRLPLVWPGGSYTNNGTAIGGVYHRSSWGTPIYFESDWDDQYRAADFGGVDAAYGGQVDLFVKDFKFPQMFRASLAVDQKLPWGLIGTIEGIFTKTINNVNYFNINTLPATETLDGADNRPYYGGGTVTSDYTRIMLGKNTSKGYTYNFTAAIEKPFQSGLTASLAYTFGRAMVLNEGTSSQNSSQWRYMEQVNGLNNLDLSYSDFDIGHRIVGFINYRVEYLNHLATSISIFYNGQSGHRYSYIYGDYGDLNGNSESDNNLIYVPKDQSEIVFADPATADQQWEELDKFIKNDDYLSERRGKYAERNGTRLPFSHIFDLKIAQDIFMNFGPGRHTLQLTLDVFNVGNMINKKWGRRYYLSDDYYRLLDFEGFVDDANGDYTPTFEMNTRDGDIWNIDDSGYRSSRWQAQIGIRYIF